MTFLIVCSLSLVSCGGSGGSGADAPSPTSEGSISPSPIPTIVTTTATTEGAGCLLTAQELTAIIGEDMVDDNLRSGLTNSINCQFSLGGTLPLDPKSLKVTTYTDAEASPEEKRPYYNSTKACSGVGRVTERSDLGRGAFEFVCIERAASHRPKESTTVWLPLRSRGSINVDVSLNVGRTESSQELMRSVLAILGPKVQG